ncbi:uncharacterized protein LOC134686948 [Mytilus trossulus]|uniref:uncharacterized protein LOC134686948 n=1 Tax=Mytilus trossulus TaxID=6551 RepID=UPI0030069646
MADRRAPRFRQRSNQWNSSDPANWTANKLKVELESINIFVPVSLGKNMLKKIYMDNIARRKIAPADQQMTGNTSQTSASSDIAPSTSTADASSNLNSVTIASSNQAPDQRDLTSDSGSNSARSISVTEPRMNFPSGTTGSTSSNMAAPSANVNNEVMTGMLNSMQSMQGTMLGLQQTVIKLININDKPVTVGVEDNNLSTAYAAMGNNDPGPRPSTSAGAESPCSQAFPLNDKQISSPCKRSTGGSMQSSSSSTCVMELDTVVSQLWEAAISTGTRKTYETGFRSYTSFLLLTGVVALILPGCVPVNEQLLLLFVAYCTSRLHISYSTIKLYLCGIRFKCLELNINYPDLTKLRRLKAILNGVKRTYKTNPKPRYPITFDILQKVCLWLRQNSSYENLLLETMCTVAFFGFLRCGEFTVDSCGNFDPAFNLCISDITILSDSIHLKLKISKTDPFRQGVTIKLFETGTEICPHRICCLYMNNRFQRNPSPETPLFVDLTGAAVTRAKFLSLFKHALDSLGIDSTYYSGHSFRIGAATTAGSVQVEDHLIKVMGRWSSDAYCRYIKISESDLKRAQNSLAKN